MPEGSASILWLLVGIIIGAVLMTDASCFKSLRDYNAHTETRP